MSSHPTSFVLVPGAWHNATTYDKVISLLSAQGFKSIAVSLPSTSGDKNASVKDDIEATRAAITGETTQGNDVVVVVHSYGGIVGASAMKDLTTKQNESDGLVIGFVMLASGFAQTGAAFMEGLGGMPPPFWTADAESGFATLVGDPRPVFYHDLPIEEGEMWVKRLEKQSLKALYEGGEHIYAGWKDVPVFTAITTDDRSFPPEFQRMFAQAAKDTGGDVTIREIFSSHSPMLSKPDEVVEIMIEAVKVFAEKALKA
jgi:pimeloyl-ACP methyl ester carboxylesterase